MSRITEAELECRDLEWFAIDKKGQVAVFCSAGVGNVPEFVCADEDKTNELMELFDLLPTISETEICFPETSANRRFVEAACDFSKKGLYYFDSDDHTNIKNNVASLKEYYTITSKPLKQIFVNELPVKIQELIKENLLPINDFSKTTIIKVLNAY